MPFMDNLEHVDISWQPLIQQSLKAMNPHYLARLFATGSQNRGFNASELAISQSASQCDDLSWVPITWLPGQKNIFSAFKMPLEKVKFILLGESPYPRAASANGYAFWDAAVGSMWSETGLSKKVNRATSLRNLIKMLLHARGDLYQDFSQDAIAGLNKSRYLQTASQLFQAFMNHGFLLLNASLVYSPGKVHAHAKHWRIFMSTLFRALADNNPSLKLVLLGRIANQLPESKLFAIFKAEHPYNISFVTNPDVLDFFKPFDLLNHEYNDRSD